MRRLILWVPLGIFLGFLVTVGFGLYQPADRIIRSRLVGTPIPAFALPAALPGRPGLSAASFSGGRPRVLNFFASWCVPCIAEAPQLLELERRGVPIDAVAVRDRPDDVAAFLDRWGDPYQRIGSDNESRVQLALGSTGVPETFVVDGNGVILYQHVGVVRPEDVDVILKAYRGKR